jgi:hypothetical protein
VVQENDEEGYLRLLGAIKNDRLARLVDQTEDFLARIGARIEQQQQHPADPADSPLAAPAEVPSDSTAGPAVMPLDAAGAAWATSVLARRQQYYSLAVRPAETEKVGVGGD